MSEIHVAGGLYRPTFRWDVNEPRSATFFLRNAFALRGGYAGDPSQPDLRDPALYVSTLSGDLGAQGDTTDNSWHVIRALSAINNTSILDGFVISDGNADRNEDRGAGMHLQGDPTIVDCQLIYNHATYAGAAVYNTGDPTFLGCTFESNTTDGGLGGTIWTQGDTRYTNCTFRNNLSVSVGGAVITAGYRAVFTHCNFEHNASGSGGAIGGTGLFMSIDRCRFVGNSATQGGALQTAMSTWLHVLGSDFIDNVATASGGAIADHSGSTVLVGNRFWNNTSGADGGAVAITNSAASMTDCVFDGNRAVGGAAVYDAGSGTVISSCTFAGNVASGATGGGIDIHGPASIVNSILWGNSDATGSGELAQIHVSSGSAAISNSCVTGWTGALGGTGNIGADPAFLDADGFDATVGTQDDDLRPGASSPCVDAGDAALLPPDVLDLDGDSDTVEALPLDLDFKPRVLGGALDIGSYEYSINGPSGYCTAKVNSLGCVPEIRSSGFPSLSGFDDFRLLADSVLNNKPGLLIWGFAPSAMPFAGGTLCVHAPLKRVAAVGSGGNPPPNDCSGAYASALTHAYMLSHGLTSGVTAYAQFWMRDPGFAPSEAVALTAGLQFTVFP